LHGPLSQHLNALAFLVLGTSLRTLILLNLAILAGTTFLIYRTLDAASGRLTATAAAFVFLTVSGFAHLSRVGNYNFVCPYTHEATHGMALTILMIALILRWLGRGGADALSLAGLCYGLAILTKTEVALAASAAVLLGATVALLTGHARPGRGRGVAVPLRPVRDPAGGLLLSLFPVVHAPGKGPARPLGRMGRPRRTGGAKPLLSPRGGARRSGRKPMVDAPDGGAPGGPRGGGRRRRGRD